MSNDVLRKTLKRNRHLLPNVFKMQEINSSTLLITDFPKLSDIQKNRGDRMCALICDNYFK